MSGEFAFEVLIDESYLQIFPDIELDADHNLYRKKRVVSMINNFEEGKWRLTYFIEFLKNNIHYAALTEKERRSLISRENYSTLTSRSFQNIRLLKAQDRNGKDLHQVDGEIAEIFLYGIMQRYFKALPVVPKIFYKQNTQDTVKGADSVHIILEDNEDFSLWLGEAKFYSDFNYQEIISSVFDTFTRDKLKKDNSLIVSYTDLSLHVEDRELLQKINNTLHPDTSLDETKKRLVVPILVIHECDITLRTRELSDAYKEEIKELHKNRAKKYFKKQVDKQKKEKAHLYDEIRFVLIIFPVPNKKNITEAMTKQVKHYQDK